MKIWRVKISLSYLHLFFYGKFLEIMCAQIQTYGHVRGSLSLNRHINWALNNQINDFWHHIFIQNFKSLNLWGISLIYCLTFTLIINMGLNSQMIYISTFSNVSLSVSTINHHSLFAPTNGLCHSNTIFASWWESLTMLDQHIGHWTTTQVTFDTTSSPKFLSH
jgi:hypothetical protein